MKDMLDIYHTKYRNLLKPYKSKKDDLFLINRIELFKSDGQKLFSTLQPANAPAKLVHVNA